MDRVVHFQQQTRLATAQHIQHKVSDDVADIFEYVPRHRGDFPPLAFEPIDAPPSSNRYDIVDRIFEDDLPVYILRPRTAIEHGLSLSNKRRSSSLRSQPAQRTLNGGSRSSSRGSKSAGNTADSGGYDAEDSMLLQIDLVDLHRYVTARELERFETFRFEHPQMEDEPARVPMSRASSDIPRREREQRATSREQRRRAGSNPRL
jgi:hypothetical protein